MRLRDVVWLGIALTTGCSNPAKDAEAQYNITDQYTDDRCAAAQNVKQKWLEQKNQEEFERWAIKVQIDCNRDAWPGEADNMASASAR